MAWATSGNIKGTAGTNASNPNFTFPTPTNLGAGATPTATVTGTYPNLSITFGIPQGAAGTNGTNGTNGARGSNWYVGAGAPGTITGSLPGDQYLNTTNGDVYTLS